MHASLAAMAKEDHLSTRVEKVYRAWVREQKMLKLKAFEKVSRKREEKVRIVVCAQTGAFDLLYFHCSLIALLAIVVLLMILTMHSRSAVGVVDVRLLDTVTAACANWRYHHRKMHAA